MRIFKLYLLAFVNPYNFCLLIYDREFGLEKLGQNIKPYPLRARSQKSSRSNKTYAWYRTYMPLWYLDKWLLWWSYRKLVVVSIMPKLCCLLIGYKRRLLISTLMVGLFYFGGFLLQIELKNIFLWVIMMIFKNT